MKAPIVSASLSSSTCNNLPPLIYCNDPNGIARTPVLLPDEAGNGWMELIPLAVGMTIVRGGADFKENARGRLISFGYASGELAESTLVISTVRTGRMIIRENNLENDFQCGKGYTVFRHLSRLDYQIIIDATTDIDGINLFVGVSALTMLLGIEIAEKLFEKLAISGIPSATVKAIPPQITSILHSAVQEHFTGTMRKLHAQAKSLEFLSALTQHLVLSEQAGLTAANRKQVAIEQLHGELMHLEGKIPTLDEIANQYGISARALNEEFKKSYGSSIYAYISELRLNLSHETLLNTTTPMKIIAMNLGYSHVNHFISAFRKKFGYSPGSLRKK